MWTAHIGERPSGGPWLLGNRVLYAGYSGKLTALSAGTGAVLWEFKSDQITVPVLNEGMLYFAATAKGASRSGGQVIAVDAASGQQRWSTFTAARGSVLVSGDRVLVRLPAGWVALDRLTGQEAWHSDASSDGGTAEPVIVGSTALLPEYGGRMRAVDLRTGKVRWQFLASSESFPEGEAFAKEAADAAQTPEGRQFFAITSARAVYGYGAGMCRFLVQGRTEEQILGDARQFLGTDVAQAISTAARKTLCPDGTGIDAVASLEKRAAPAAREGISSPPAVHGERVFVRTRTDPFSGAVYVLDLSSGGVLLRKAAAAGGSPVGDDDMVYFIDVKERRRELHAVQISTSKEIWTVDVTKQRVDYAGRLRLSKAFVYAGNVRVDRQTGTVEWPMPFDLGHATGPGDAECFIHAVKPAVISRFDFATGQVLWRLPVENLKSPGFRVACSEDAAFFYDDWSDYPLFGVQLQ